MDETLDKKLRSLRLKLMMAEKELQASSGKWKLGALLHAGHVNTMNREVDRLRERLEGKIDKLKSEIAALTGETLPSKVKPETPKPALAKKPEEKKSAAAPKTEPAKKPEPAKKAAVKKAAAPAPKKSASKKASPASKSTGKSTAKKSGKK